MKTSRTSISLCDALHVKSAELWLKLGQPTEALMELQRLQPRAHKHPWTVRVCRSAYHTICQ